ncbi:MAG TPA: class I SAM-dependent methyltransferase [Steroidobacteraceae bacterium]|jgi:SAM-dependent methyltransferase
MSGQKDTFLASEGDAWFTRNAAALQERDWSRDVVSTRLAALASGQPLRVLEIGCGDGSRLQFLAGLGHQVFGVDPSAKAVARTLERGVRAQQGTADALPVADAVFDVVIFGFCLYLCDDTDLFRIAQEADRALASEGWLLILDFDAAEPVYRPYHHAPGLMSRKMDYKSMFLWHPAYSLVAYEKMHHVTQQWTDDPNEWISVACLRKHPPAR